MPDQVYTQGARSTTDSKADGSLKTDMASVRKKKRKILQDKISQYKY